MFVRGRMSKPVITVEPDQRIMETMALMKEKNIRRTPVVENGRLIGIVSDKDLLNAGPSDATSLSVWEVNYLFSRIRVEEVMTRNVLTVTEDTPIEEAAVIMVNNKIGGLPVMKGTELVGLITETDLFKIFQELMGARDPGVRVTALVPDIQGELDRLTHVISEAGGSFIAFGMFDGDAPGNKLVTCKVVGLSEDEVESVIEPVIDQLVDLRTCC